MKHSTVSGPVRFDPVGSGARLSWDWDVKAGGVGRVLAPLVSALGRRQERPIWSGLKRFVEGRPARRPREEPA